MSELGNHLQLFKRSSRARQRKRLRNSTQRAGLAALEVVLTTVVTMLMFSFAAYWTMRLARIVFSVIGEMVGSPLM